jgi:hypothetical protein
MVKERSRLSIAEAVRRASAEARQDRNDDSYLRNTAIAARAIRLLLSDEDIDEDNLEFGVSFTWPNVPSPTGLVRAFMEQRAAQQERAVVSPVAPQTPTAIQAFVYGVIMDELFVVPQPVAERWAGLGRALHTCETWGELKAQAPPELYKEALQALGRRRMAADRAIADDLEALLEEGFPPPLGQIMRKHLPAGLTSLVCVGESVWGDELPFLPTGALPQVIEVFASLGVACTEDQALVVRAAGYNSDRPEEMR